MSKQIKNDLLGSLKETFALGVREFSRSLTGTLTPETTVGGSTAHHNQISHALERREQHLIQQRQSV